MQQANSMIATGGRDASRERRSRLVQGKSALPAAGERSRAAELTAVSSKPVAPVAVKQVVAAAPVSAPAPAPVAPAPQSATKILGGRAASLARRSVLVQGKGAMQKSARITTSTMTPVSAQSVVNSGATSPADNSRQVSQAMRAQRARSGRGDAAPSRPCGRVREPSVIQYPAKVADTTTYAGQKVTGVRIGRGKSMTGDESGSNLPVSGTQYIGTESGYAPRMGGTKVGATRTSAGLPVTGTQVRSTIKVTGDESNPALRITGEADQELADDLMQRDDNASSGSQFQRMHNPHGHSVHGGNLGRSAKAFGSRERDRERATEQSMDGRAISGTAIGRSANVTGDEPGSCRTLTGSQYLKPASRQELCEPSGTRGNARAMGMNGRLDPVTGEKVSISETWTRQRISGIAVEHNPGVTGSEPGVCSILTGTPYVGPGEYGLNCSVEAASEAHKRITPMPGQGAGNHVTGNTARSTERVTGTHRGSDRGITGTAYYRTDSESVIEGNAVDHVNSRFSVRSPQREAQLQADATAVNAPTAESRITGTFACGEGKITGNQEFHFSPRGRSSEKSRVSGEGSTEGRTVTGSAWGLQKNVAGTEGYIAAERNPSRRDGSSHVFANATKFKGMGNATPPTQHLTGASGWSEKSTTRVTLSGGCLG